MEPELSPHRGFLKKVIQVTEATRCTVVTLVVRAARKGTHTWDAAVHAVIGAVPLLAALYSAGVVSRQIHRVCAGDELLCAIFVAGHVALVLIAVTVTVMLELSAAAAAFRHLVSAFRRRG